MDALEQAQDETLEFEFSRANSQNQTIEPGAFIDKINRATIDAIDDLNLRETSMPETRFYQTEYAAETIAIIEDPDGSLSIGIARAGRTDKEKRLVSAERGMQIAEGRARKVRITKTPIIEKNYLRAVHAPRV